MKTPFNFALAAAAVIAVALGQPASAVEDEDFGLETTEDLYQICSTPPGDANYVPAAFGCRGFIEATVQYHDEVSDRKNLKRLICYPKGTTIADGREAFVAWAKEHVGDDKLMNEQPVVGLVRALAARYPCR